MRHTLWSLCCTAAMTLPVLARIPASEPRVALVIGNGAYRDSPLHNPVQDARAMAGVLREFGFRVTELENAGQQRMEDAVRTFRDQLGQDHGVGLFYFAGHGVSVGGKNYLLPVGQVFTSESDVRYKSTEAGFVLGAMEDAGARVSLLVLDACRNNPFGARSLYRSAARGLAVIEAPKGSLVAYATAPGATAADGAGEHGLYTQELIRAIREMPELEVEQLMKKVSARVQAGSGGAQLPYRSSSLTGEFFFRPATGGSSGAPPPGTRLEAPPAMVTLLGGLQVGVNAPEARVYVNGETKGTASPASALSLPDLPAGSVQVRVEAPGHQPQEQAAEIRPGQWTQVQLVLAPVEPVPASGDPLGPETLGRVWVVREGDWTGIWTRRGDSHILDASWRSVQGQDARDVIVIEKLEGDRIVLFRQGVNGRYSGRVDLAGHSIVDGTATWYPAGVHWSAELRQATFQDPLGPETLGRVWVVREGGVWTGVWTRRGDSHILDASWRSVEGQDARDVIVIEKLEGDRIVLFRQGVNGRYSGRVDLVRGSIVDGTATWYPAGVHWSAELWSQP